MRLFFYVSTNSYAQIYDENPNLYISCSHVIHAKEDSDKILGLAMSFLFASHRKYVPY